MSQRQHRYPLTVTFLNGNVGVVSIRAGSTKSALRRARRLCFVLEVWPHA